MKTEPTSQEIHETKLEVLQMLCSIWGKRKLPREMVRFEVFDLILKRNKNYNYTWTRLKVWKEI